MKSALTSLAAAGILAACAASPAVTTAIHSSSASAGAAVPAGTVPWADLPSEPQAPPTALPTLAPAADARPCRLSDLAMVPEANGGATGNVFTRISFINHSHSTCLLAGHPYAAIHEPGHPTVIGRPTTTWQMGVATNQAPGEASSMLLVTSSACEGGAPGPAYHQLTLTLPSGGGTMSLHLAEGVIPRSCGFDVTGFGVQQPPPTYPPDPQAALTASLLVPATAPAGETLNYVVRLANRSDVAIALQPCPTYIQYGPPGVKQFLLLNCAAATAIAAHGSEAFAMRMQLPPSELGSIAVCWTLAAAGAQSTCTSVTVRGPT